MLNVLRFWMDRGVDGFRVDVIWHIVKDDQFRDNDPDPNYQPHWAPHRQLLATYNTDRPEVHDIISRMRRVLDEYDDRMMVGEIYLPIERLMMYYGSEGAGVHLPFNFQLIELPWHARAIADAVDRYEGLLPSHGWPNWVLGNHDNPRIASRISPRQARIAAMLLLTLRGTPTLYYGDEIGMHNVPIPPDRVQDPFEKNVPGLGHGRDPERTPMQWSSAESAGFTSGRAWLPIADDYPTVNVEQLKNDRESILTLYRQLIELRNSEPALSIGGYTSVPLQGDLLVYSRHQRGAKPFLIALNFGEEPVAIHPPDSVVRGKVALSTALDREGEIIHDGIELRPQEGIIIELKGD
jgi:alpha-glucosidase